MVELLIITLLVILSVPVVMFVIECVLGIPKASRWDLTQVDSGTNTVIIIPAHNEERLIGRTLESLKPQIPNSDTVIVVADNCTDSTAAIVRKHGMLAIERSNDDKRGKGYALSYGMDYLRQQETPPDIVIIVDADCLLEPKALSWLKQRVIQLKRPVQACYLMKRGATERLSVKVSEFAFMVKNRVRLRGLSRLGMPVPLTGTGMAFPWQVISQAKLATGDIVEDMRLGVELAEQGVGAAYCDEAQVYSYFPTGAQAEKTQRERWEHGHLSTFTQFVPRLFKRAITGPSIKALGMMLDLLIPPLSLLVLLISTIAVFFLVVALAFGTWTYFIISATYLGFIATSVLAVWLSHGRTLLSGREILHIPIYALSKIVIYVGYLLRKQTKWIRTDRH